MRTRNRRERRFDERIAGAMRLREERHPVPVPSDLNAAIMASVRAVPVALPVELPAPWWRRGVAIAAGLVATAATAVAVWLVGATQVYPLAKQYLGLGSSTETPLDLLRDLIATTPPTDIVCFALVALTFVVLLASRVSPLHD